MNLFDRIKTAASVILGKTMTADEWKKGGILGGYGSDQGAQTPFRDSSLVYVAASKISENLPQAPLWFYNRSTGAQLGMESPVVRLFARPNEKSSYFSFFEELTLFLALYGETFFWVGDSKGRASGTSTVAGQLIQLNPTRMQHVIEDGKLIGWTYDNGSKRLALNADEVMQVKFPNPYDAYRGLAPIDSVKTDVDSDYLAGRFARAFFQNGANPGIVFTLNDDDESSKEQRESFIKEWNQSKQGSSKQYKTAILNSGMEVKKVGLTQEEMDYIKQRNFNTERVLSVFGVPPPMAGFYEQATYGNVRTAKKIFWNETIKAYARRYESVLNNFFLPVYYPGTFCKFNFSQIDELKHDAKETADIVNIYASHGVPMNVLIESFELPFNAQEGLDVGFQPMTMLEVGTSFLDIQNDSSKELVNVTPSAFDKVKQVKQIIDIRDKKIENTQLFDRFSKNLHNYLYRQREKVLKVIANDKNLDNSFWIQENDRLVTKFEPIYTEYGLKADDLVSINTFNRKFVEKITISQNGNAPEKIRQLYNKFDKTVGNLKQSRVSAISQKEIDLLLEQTCKEGSRLI